MVNGVILLGAERLRRRAPARAPALTAYAYAGAGLDPGGGGIRRSAPGSGGAVSNYFLRYFQTRTLAPFGLYSLGFGLAMTIYTTV